MVAVSVHLLSTFTHYTGRDPITRADLDAVSALLDAAAQGGRSWTTPHLRHWLATERSVRVSTGRLGVLLRRARFRWKRTKRSVRHMRKDPSLQDAADALSWPLSTSARRYAAR